MKREVSKKVIYPFKCRDTSRSGCTCQAENEQELREKFSLTWGGYWLSPRRDCKECVAKDKQKRKAEGTWYNGGSYSPEDYPGGGSCLQS